MLRFFSLVETRIREHFFIGDQGEIMTSFKLSGVLSVLLVFFIGAGGTELTAQGKGRSGERSGQRGDRGGEGNRGKERAPQARPQPQQRQERQARQPQQRQERQARQPQQRQERQARQPGQRLGREGDQRRRQADSVNQRRGDGDRVRVARMQQQQQQQLQRQRQANSIFQRRANERRVQPQRPAGAVWQGRDRRNDERSRGNDDRRASIRNRQNDRQPQIVPQQKSGSWFARMAERRNGRDRGDDRRDRSRGIDRRDRNDDRRNRGRADGRPKRKVVVRQIPYWNGGWPSNFGQFRSSQVRQRNADRQASRRDRDRRSYQRNAGSPIYSGPTVIWQEIYTARPRYNSSYPGYPSSQIYSTYSDYGSNPYSSNSGYNSGYPYSGYSESYSSNYNERPSAGDILRNVIFSILGGGNHSYGNYAPQHGSGYSPGYNHPDGYYSPQYAGYNDQPYYQGYTSYNDPYGYSDPYNYNDPYLNEVLPVQYMAGNTLGGDMFRQLFGQLLAIGYDQGFQDGAAASTIRESERAFYDPYAYDNDSYDPYSVSLGDNRRLLSQGYELGYHDALDDVSSYDEIQHGEVDLLSVLIGTVSQLM